MEDTFENIKKLFNAENYLKAKEQSKIDREKRDQLKEYQKKERERLNLAVKALRDERGHREVRDGHLEQQKAEVVNKHRKFHARKLVALSEANSTVPSSNGHRRSANLSSGSGDTVVSDIDQDFALSFLKNAEIQKEERKIDEATKTKLPPIKKGSFLQILNNW